MLNEEIRLRVVRECPKSTCQGLILGLPEATCVLNCIIPEKRDGES